MTVPMLVIAVLVFSCHKENTATAASQYYPNKVGDSWVYNVTDSLQLYTTVKHYQVNVTIVGIKKLADGKSATIWQYQRPGGNDINYVRLTQDTLKIFDITYSKTSAYLAFPRLIFLVPFHVNQRWENKPLGSESARVINQADINIGGKGYTGCYDIYQEYGGPNIALNDHYFFKPFLGMVRKTFIDSELGHTSYQSWELQSFTIH